MQELISSIYLFLKSGHVIFMVFWLAGLFMLPRQCIYMLDHEPGSAGEAKWATRMGKLRAIILNLQIGQATPPFGGAPRLGSLGWSRISSTSCARSSIAAAC